MCVLRDTYLIEDPAYLEPIEEPKKVQVETKVYEFRHHTVPVLKTTYFWCRTCKQQTPVHLTKTCDCGMIMCVSCWEEWEVTCPICDATVG